MMEAGFDGPGAAAKAAADAGHKGPALRAYGKAEGGTLFRAATEMMEAGFDGPGAGAKAAADAGGPPAASSSRVGAHRSPRGCSGMRSAGWSGGRVKRSK